MTTLAVTTTVPAVPLDSELAKKVKNAAMRHELWRVERDRLIVAASIAGASTREIAQLVGLSHVGVSKIVNKAYRNRMFNPLRQDSAEARERDREELMKELQQLYPEAFPQDDDQTSTSS